MTHPEYVQPLSVVQEAPVAQTPDLTGVLKLVLPANQNAAPAPIASAVEAQPQLPVAAAANMPSPLEQAIQPVMQDGRIENLQRALHTIDGPNFGSIYDHTVPRVNEAAEHAATIGQYRTEEDEKINELVQARFEMNQIGNTFNNIWTSYEQLERRVAELVNLQAAGRIEHGNLLRELQIAQAHLYGANVTLYQTRDQLAQGQTTAGHEIVVQGNVAKLTRTVNELTQNLARSETNLKQILADADDCIQQREALNVQLDTYARQFTAAREKYDGLFEAFTSLTFESFKNRERLTKEPRMSDRHGRDFIAGFVGTRGQTPITDPTSKILALPVEAPRLTKPQIGSQPPHVERMTQVARPQPAGTEIVISQTRDDPRAQGRQPRPRNESVVDRLKRWARLVE